MGILLIESGPGFGRRMSLMYVSLPQTAPVIPYILQPRAPQIQYLWIKTLMVTVGPMVVILEQDKVVMVLPLIWEASALELFI